MLASSAAWNLKIAEGAIAGSLSAVDAQKALKWAIESAKPRGRSECRLSIGAAYESLKEAGHLPPGLQACDVKDLDKKATFAPSLGAPNGVIDLNTGALLPREEGRKRLVSRTVPDDFKPDAQHSMVDQLFEPACKSRRSGTGTSLVRRRVCPSQDINRARRDVHVGRKEAERQDNAS